MSNRTVVELNHDFCPHSDESLWEWAQMMRAYMTSGDKDYLPNGVTFKCIRHHSEPDPLPVMGDLLDGSVFKHTCDNLECEICMTLKPPKGKD